MSFNTSDKTLNKLYGSQESLAETNYGGSQSKKDMNENEENEENSLNESSASFPLHESDPSLSDFVESLRRRPIHRRHSRESTPVDADHSATHSSQKFKEKPTRDKTPSSLESSSHRSKSFPSLKNSFLSPEESYNLSTNKEFNNIKKLKNCIFSFGFPVFLVLLILSVLFNLYSSTFFKYMNERELSTKTVQLEKEILSLQVYFPKQTQDFWIVLTAQLTSVLLVDEPIEPGTLLFVIPNNAEATINCFIKDLIERLNRLLGTHHDSSAIIDSLDFKNEKPGVGKLMIDTKLKHNFNRGQVLSVIKHTESLKAEDVMIFHGYCDTINAPFKRSIFMLTYHTSSTPIDPLDLIPSLQKHMKNLWLNVLGEDSFGSLMTRISNMVVHVNPEDILHCSSN